MKSIKRLLSMVCVVCMFFAIAIPASASANEFRREPTQSTEVILNDNSTSHIISFPVARDYGYWKVAIQNRSSAGCWFEITEDSPSGEAVYTSGTIPAESTLEFRSSSDSPLPDGSYYIVVHSADGSVNLDGTMWYKQGTTFEDVAD